jgi:hypothetical protein
MVRGEFQNHSDDNNKKSWIDDAISKRKERERRIKWFKVDSNSSKNIRSHRRTMKMRCNKKRGGDIKTNLKKSGKE